MPGIRKNSSAIPRIGTLAASFVLWLACVSVANGFVSRNPSKNQYANNLALRAWFMGDKSTSTATPKVQAPENFVIPEPKPLEISESTDMGRFTRNTLAFAVRLGVGAFVLGWKIDTIFFKDDESQESKKYSLKLGPFSIRDTSSVLNTEDPSAVPRPEQPLVLYEYDASPYCKRVREFINLLDLTVEYRPCPGARQGKFSDELYEKTGRRTVRCLCQTFGIFVFSLRFFFLVAVM